MKSSEVKQEYQLKVWGGMIQQQKASGLSVKSWCVENGVSENAYYYRLRKIRQTACTTLEQMQEVTLAEVQPKSSVWFGRETDFYFSISVCRMADINGPGQRRKSGK